MTWYTTRVLPENRLPCGKRHTKIVVVSKKRNSASLVLYKPESGMITNSELGEIPFARFDWWCVPPDFNCKKGGK